MFIFLAKSDKVVVMRTFSSSSLSSSSPSQAPSRGLSRDETPLDRLKRATVNTVRAVAGRRDVLVGFSGESGGVEEAGRLLVRVPVPRADLAGEALSAWRGEADLAALRVRHHRAEVFARFVPERQKEAGVFSALEEARLEAIGSREMVGVRENLTARLQREALVQGLDKALSPHDVPLRMALRHLVREALCVEPVVDAARAAVKLRRDEIAEKIGSSRLAQLSLSLYDQEAYARASLDLIGALYAREKEQDETHKESDESPSPAQDPPEPEKNEVPPQSGEDGADEPEEEGDSSITDGELLEGVQDVGVEGDGHTAPNDEDSEAAEFVPRASPVGQDGGDLANLPGYGVFTRGFDEVVAADQLADADELASLRAQMDRKLDPLRPAVARLANRLQRKLMARQRRQWAFDLEEGLLDSARLARVVTDPSSGLSFKLEQETDFRDTVVTVLIDNSGSMRGRPIAIAALCADVLAQSLERCGVKVEILGFTTRTWRGGRARELWNQSGKPVNPGRVNEVRHVIYKAADVPMRRARRNLALMLREGLLKENIDGEALVWAHQRLMARGEQRRILMVVSDGAPVDDATLALNWGTYLDDHLRAVIGWIEARSTVDLVAVGIGHDVTRYYRRAVTLTDVMQLGDTMTDELTELFCV